ncbi:hypothetical protein HZC08_01300 [Candidatus Micrarchaeota archaeon]|nr:hypothetical protein [Candidatus Micrarchaeota archaeon]
MEELKTRKELQFIPKKEEGTKVIPVKLQAEELHHSNTVFSNLANNLTNSNEFAQTAFQASAKLELAKNAERVKANRNESYSLVESFSQALSFI